MYLNQTTVEDLSLLNNKLVIDSKWLAELIQNQKLAAHLLFALLIAIFVLSCCLNCCLTKEQKRRFHSLESLDSSNDSGIGSRV